MEKNVISMTNMIEKSNGTYIDLPLEKDILNPDIISFSKYVEELLSYENEKSDDERIDLTIDSGTISKYNLPFDFYKILIYID